MQGFLKTAFKGLMFILGISAYSRDSSACIINNGQVLACAQEQWFTRIPHDSAFPHRAIRFCLKTHDLRTSDLALVVFSEKPLTKLGRVLATSFSSAPRGFAAYAKIIPELVKRRSWKSDFINQELEYSGEVAFCTNHLSLAGSAYYPSPFDEAAVLVADSLGEWSTNSMGVAKGNRMALFKGLHFPHSIGMLYSAVADFLGIQDLNGERQLAGLSSVGEPTYLEELRNHVIDVKEDGSYHINHEQVDFLIGQQSMSKKFAKLIGRPARDQRDPFSQADFDLAASIQQIAEDIIVKQVSYLRSTAAVDNLCIAGSFAYNPRVIGRIYAEAKFKNIWVQPASGAAASALGAALCTYYGKFGKEREIASETISKSPCLFGPDYPDDSIERSLLRRNASYQRIQGEALLTKVSDHLMAEKTVAWFNARLEFSDQVLGSRCILADPRVVAGREKLELLSGNSEEAASYSAMVLEEDLWRYCDYSNNLINAEYTWALKPEIFSRPVQFSAENEPNSIAKSIIPVVTQNDKTTNFRVISENDNLMFYKLLKTFKRKTGCSMLAGIKFCMPESPVVCTPGDAYDEFMQLPIDVLVLGNYILLKEQQPVWIDSNTQKSGAF